MYSTLKFMRSTCGKSNRLPACHVGHELKKNKFYLTTRPGRFFWIVLQSVSPVYNSGNYFRVNTLLIYLHRETFIVNNVIIWVDPLLIHSVVYWIFLPARWRQSLSKITPFSHLLFSTTYVFQANELTCFGRPHVSVLEWTQLTSRMWFGIKDVKGNSFVIIDIAQYVSQF